MAYPLHPLPIMRCLLPLLVLFLVAAPTADARGPAVPEEDARTCSELTIEPGHLFVPASDGLLLETTRLPCTHPLPGPAAEVRVRTVLAGDERVLSRRDACDGAEGYTVDGSLLTLCPVSCGRVEFATTARVIVGRCR